MIILLIIVLIPLALFLYTLYRLHTSTHMHVASSEETPEMYKLAYQHVMLETKDEFSIAAWYIRTKNPKAVVILVHGYDDKTGGKSRMLTHAKYLHDAGYSTLLIDLRSFGESAGKKISFGSREWRDVEAAYDYVAELPENKEVPIGFFGNSMGGATVLVAQALTGKGDFVIASVPFANFKRLFDMQLRAEHLSPILFLPFLRLAGYIEFGFSHNAYTPSAVMKRVRQPLFVISAKYDKKVHPQDAKYLFDLGNEPKTFWEADSGHDIYKELPKEFEKRVIEFLQTIIT